MNQNEIEVLKDFIKNLEWASEDCDTLKIAVKPKVRQALRHAIALAESGVVEALESVQSGMESDAVLCSGEWQTGMFCGLEDKGIQDRYEACEYGYNVALDRVADWATGGVKSALAKLKGEKG
jgi:hypothetical protein